MTVQANPGAPKGLAVVIGAQGGIGSALYDALSKSSRFEKVVGFSRAKDGIDLTSEATIRAAAASVTALAMPLRLVIVATGLLHDAGPATGKDLAATWTLTDCFAALPSMPLAQRWWPSISCPCLGATTKLSLRPCRQRSAASAITISAAGTATGAAKAALNQFIRTASIELRRTHPLAICVALHPGTVATGLSAPFRSAGHEPVEPGYAAERLLGVIDGLRPIDSGLLLDHSGLPLPW